MPVDTPETDPTFVFPVRPETPSGNPENPKTTHVTLYITQMWLCSDDPRNGEATKIISGGDFKNFL